MHRILILTLVLSVSAFGIAADSPNSGRPSKLPGLENAARISRDVAGIAHIRADSEHDLFFLQGWVHAADRLFQMDASRRRASGTLAELLGDGALPSDVQLRTLGLRRAAAASAEIVSPRARAAIKAYADGVNAWVGSHPLPPEYAALELTTFEPWTPLDSLTVAKSIAFGLSFGLEDIENTINLLTYQAAGEAAGVDGTVAFFADCYRSAPFDPASTIPDASGLSAAMASEEGTPAIDLDHVDPAVLDLGRAYLERARRNPFLAKTVDRDDRPGSNEWVVGGEHSATGLPLLANDPHLALDTPSTFYPIHLVGGAFDVMGNGFAGVPFVITGQNRFISWGATVNPMDVTDVYSEQVVPDPSSPSGLSTLFEGSPEPIIPIPEVFRTNVVGDGVTDNIVVVPPAAGVPAATLIVPRRNMGPIIELDAATGAALSVQFTGFGPTREIETFLRWDLATGLDDFLDGLQYFDFGSQNFAYADVDGNIAYFTSAEMPIREDLQAEAVTTPPYFIRNGQGGHEWLPVQNPQPGQAVPYEILPFDEMPHIVNPPAGYAINANNDPVGTTLDNNPLNQLRPGGGVYYLSPGYDGLRGGRITQRVRELLAAGGKISFEDMQAIQADVVLIDAQFFTPSILGAYDRASAEGAIPDLAAFAADPRIAEAIARLADWDFSTPTGIPEGYDAVDVDGERGEPTEDEIAASVAATVYSVWRGQFVRNVLDTTLEPLGMPSPRSGNLALSALRTLLENFELTGGRGLSGIDFFARPGIDDPDDRRDVVILESLAGALDLLSGEAFEPAFGGSTDQDDYRWGKLHRIVFDHPLGPPFSVPPAGGAFPPPLPGLPGVPTDGGLGAVDASSHDVRADSYNRFMFGSGPVNRFVSEADPDLGVFAESVWPGGTSGVLGDRFYVNLLPLWLTNDTVPLLIRNSDLQHNLDSVQKFVPAPRARRSEAGRGEARKAKSSRPTRSIRRR